MDIFYGILAILSIFTLITLVDRVCKCIEHCAVSRSYGIALSSGLNIKREQMENHLKNESKR